MNSLEGYEAFREAWNELEQKGQCDGWLAMECHRVWLEYREARYPKNVKQFIAARANAGPEEDYESPMPTVVEFRHLDIGQEFTIPDGAEKYVKIASTHYQGVTSGKVSKAPSGSTSKAKVTQDYKVVTEATKQDETLLDGPSVKHIIANFKNPYE